jgi:hypothetical protein
MLAAMSRARSNPDPFYLRLWRAARAAFAALHDRVRDAGLVLQTWRARRPSAEALRLRARLNALGAYVRKLVLAEAAVLALAPVKPRADTARQPDFPRPTGFRLWPRPARAPARIRRLGPPPTLRELWRERRRRALTRLLTAARAERAARRAETDERERLLARLLALARVLRDPKRAIKRLARRLRACPRLALKIVAVPAARADPLDPAARHEVETRAFHYARRLLAGDTS